MPAKSRHFAKRQELAGGKRLRGEAGRTRTNWGAEGKHARTASPNLSTFQEMSEGREGAHSIANNFGHREHWDRQDSSRLSLHPEPENQRHDDEDGVEGETFGEEQTACWAPGRLKLATNRRLVSKQHYSTNVTAQRVGQHDRSRQTTIMSWTNDPGTKV